MASWKALSSFSLLLSFATFARADALDDYVREMMAKDHIPGVCLAVVPPGGEAPIVRSYGYANLELKVPYSPQTVHRIASISKQFCAYAILKLVKEGKIGEEDPLSKYFPNGHADWKHITIRQMLAHRSGIADPEGDFDYRKEYTPAEYVAVLAKRPVAEEPGTTYRYNNHAYALLGLIAGQVSGKGLDGFVKEQVFDPVGMSNTRYWRLEDVIPNRSDSYLWQEGEFVRPLMIRPRIFHGSGGILSTMEDMLKYEHALRKEEVLDRDVLLRQRKTFNGEESGYGAGWGVSKPNGKAVMSHSGSTFGFMTYYLREIEEGWTVILFRNGGQGDSAEWAREILKRGKEQRGTTLGDLARRSFQLR